MWIKHRGKAHKRNKGSTGLFSNPKLLKESFGLTKAAEKANLEWNASEKGNCFLTSSLTSHLSLSAEQLTIFSRSHYVAAHSEPSTGFPSHSA